MRDPMSDAPLLSCREMLRLFTDYLDDALDLVERLRFEEHLSLCDGCTDYFDQLRDVIDGADGLPVDPLPEDLRTRFTNTYELWKRGQDP